MSAFWERGYPDLPAFSPRCGFINGLVRPTFSINNSRPSRGAKPREEDDAKTSLGGGLVRLAREEAERSRRGTSRGSRDASHDDRGRQAGASPRSVLLSSLVQRGQAQPRSTEASGKGAISVQRDQDHEDYKMEVIVEPETASSPELCAGEDYFCQGS